MKALPVSAAAVAAAAAPAAVILATGSLHNILGEMKAEARVSGLSEASFQMVWI